jgi:hypothetical protein
MMISLDSNDLRDSLVATMCLPRNDIKIIMDVILELSDFCAKHDVGGSNPQTKGIFSNNSHPSTRFVLSLLRPEPAEGSKGSG